jgi:hypothetical protein
MDLSAAFKPSGSKARRSTLRPPGVREGHFHPGNHLAPLISSAPRSHDRVRVRSNNTRRGAAKLAPATCRPNLRGIRPRAQNPLLKFNQPRTPNRLRTRCNVGREEGGFVTHRRCILRAMTGRAGWPAHPSQYRTASKRWARLKRLEHAVEAACGERLARWADADGRQALRPFSTAAPVPGGDRPLLLSIRLMPRVIGLARNE